jgi:hypothetical protein
MVVEKRLSVGCGKCRQRKPKLSFIILDSVVYNGGREGRRTNYKIFRKCRPYRTM